MKVFFSKQFAEFDASRLEFRKKFIKFFQIGISLTSGVYMALVFPFRKQDLYVYLILPGFFIINNIICFLLQKKKFESFSSTYLMFILLLMPSFVMELSYLGVENISQQRALFDGLQTGIFYSLIYVIDLSSLRISIMSIIYVAHFALKQFLAEVDNRIVSSLIFAGLNLLLNLINYKKEMMNLKMWTSLKKSNEGLMHFQHLIQNFPNQIIVVDKYSLEVNQPIYFNEEALRLKSELISKEGSLIDFLICFKVEEPEQSKDKFESPIIHRPQNLFHHVRNILHDKSRNSKDFQVLHVLTDKKNKTSNTHIKNEPMLLNSEGFKSTKWEVKIGWVDWDKSDALIISFSDISLATKLRDLKKLDKNKDKLLASVSHELRTPLNGIIGMIDVAEEQIPATDTMTKNCLSIAKNSAKALLLMINDILDISQVRKGTLRLNFENVAINNLISEVLPLINIQMKKKNIEFIYENECSDKVQVYADPIRLKQILINLLGNACKFTTQGFVKLKVLATTETNKNEMDDIPFAKSDRLVSSESEGLIVSGPSFQKDLNGIKVIEFSVEDSGTGIQPENIPFLFKLFGKLEDANNSSGVGLGLAISQSLAKKLHPSGISVQSEWGKGSRFSFYVPCSVEDIVKPFLNVFDIEASIKSSKSYQARAVSFKLIEKEASKKFKLLIVDDDQVNQLVIELYLKNISDKISIHKAYNGLEAVNIVQEKAQIGYFYDLIIMDCDMPVMDGFEATKLIAEMCIKGNFPPSNIVALTANASLNDKENCMSSGMSDVWTKPISKQEFLMKISKLMAFEGDGST